ncbi:MAG: 30S ribosomal protein S8 [Zavarzinella sp.]
MMTDPIADMLTRIRNASRIERPVADMPATKLKVNIARVLKDEGFIHDFQLGTVQNGEFQEGGQPGDPKLQLRVWLKYGPEGEKVIRAIHRSSKPGRRYYKGTKQLNKVLDGLGIAILTTSSGVMSDRQAKKAGVGGEVLCVVW